MKRMKKDKNNGNGINFDASVSDLMSCLVFIFIITIVGLVVKLNDVVKKKQDALDEYSNSLKARNELMIKIKEELEKINISVFVDDENGVLSFPESSVFASGEAKVSQIGEKVFLLVGKSLSKYLKCNEDNSINYLCSKNENDKYELRVDSIVVEGHADPLPLKGLVKVEHGTNMNLSMKRSLSAFVLINTNFESGVYLNSKGEGILGAAGFGAKKPPRRFSPEVYSALFDNDKLEKSKMLVDKYNSLLGVNHNDKLSELNRVLRDDMRVVDKDLQLRNLTFMNFRRIDMRFIMSLPKILEEKNGKISSKDTP